MLFSPPFLSLVTRTKVGEGGAAPFFPPALFFLSSTVGSVEDGLRTRRDGEGLGDDEKSREGDEAELLCLCFGEDLCWWWWACPPLSPCFVDSSSPALSVDGEDLCWTTPRFSASSSLPWPNVSPPARADILLLQGVCAVRGGEGDLRERG